ncbi:hypothetical protein BC739_004238 [Kutzneria viridogrisea]|uniref:Uncharacterized protein n=1 Tax=Kutzneria viridogrisea TaxID=47990 RepID=A0ABR6BJH1_9PSEU|nr:hypothetical protein [Kutzneria albida]MBA8927032.1 hypothetical protein [Kutzneria viridogrisea]
MIGSEIARSGPGNPRSPQMWSEGGVGTSAPGSASIRPGCSRSTWIGWALSPPPR